MNNPVVVLDTETYPFRAGVMAPKVVVVALRHQGGATELVRAHDPKLDRVMQDAAAGEVTLCGHNLAYDMACLGSTRPDLVPTIFRMYVDFHAVDTILLYKLWLLRRGQLSDDENGRNRKVESFSLDAMSQSILGYPPMDKGADGWRLRYGELDASPLREWPERAREYPLGDVRAPYELLQALQWGQYPDLQRQTSYAFALHLAAVHGLRTDFEAVCRFDEEWKEKERNALAEVKTLGIIRPDGTKDTKALQAVVQEAWESTDVDPAAWERTPTGKLSASAETLTELAAKSNTPALVAYATLNHAQKSLNTFGKVFWRGITLPIHPRVDVLKATGRVSQREPNLQQLPNEKGFREVFVPRHGNVFLATDEDTAEVRAYGQTLLDEIGWSVIAEKYQKDPAWDPHCDTGAEIEGIGRTYEEAYRTHHVEHNKAFKVFRNTAKGLNFGRPGGMGPGRLVEYLRGYGVTGYSEDACRRLLQIYDAKYPETVSYGRRIAAQIDRHGGELLVETARSKRARLCTGPRAYSQARNSAFQPIVADITKLAALYVVYAQYVPGVDDRLYGTRLVNMVHDELVIEAPEQDNAYRRAASAVEEYITQHAAPVWCPDVPFRAGTTAMRRLQKADPRHNDAGELEVIP